jgi:hypothetical protein
VELSSSAPRKSARTPEPPRSPKSLAPAHGSAPGSTSRRQGSASSSPRDQRSTDLVQGAPSATLSLPDEGGTSIRARFPNLTRIRRPRATGELGSRSGLGPGRSPRGRSRRRSRPGSFRAPSLTGPPTPRGTAREDAQDEADVRARIGDVLIPEGVVQQKLGGTAVRAVGQTPGTVDGQTGVIGELGSARGGRVVLQDRNGPADGRADRGRHAVQGRRVVRFYFGGLRTVFNPDVSSLIQNNLKNKIILIIIQ